MEGGGTEIGRVDFTVMMQEQEKKAGKLPSLLSVPPGPHMAYFIHHIISFYIISIINVITSVVQIKLYLVQ